MKRIIFQFYYSEWIRNSWAELGFLWCRTNVIVPYGGISARYLRVRVCVCIHTVVLIRRVSTKRGGIRVESEGKRRESGSERGRKRERERGQAGNGIEFYAIRFVRGARHVRVTGVIARMHARTYDLRLFVAASRLRVCRCRQIWP